MFRLLLVVVIVCAMASAQNEPVESFRNRYLSVSMCQTYLEKQSVDKASLSGALGVEPLSDPLVEICTDLLAEERSILAMVRNLLSSNITSFECSGNGTEVWQKLKPVWTLFTETIESDEWLARDEICNVFTHKLNPLYCRVRAEECERKLVASVFAFWYLYAESSPNRTSLCRCSTLPHSFMRMKSNPLNPRIYEPNFDPNVDGIIVGNVCASHNMLWVLASKASVAQRANLTAQAHIASGFGLKQFQSFGSVVYDF